MTKRRRSRPRGLDHRSTRDPPHVVLAIFEAKRSIEGKHFIECRELFIVFDFVSDTTRRPRRRYGPGWESDIALECHHRIVQVSFAAPLVQTESTEDVPVRQNK